jgi:hypothetical protein
MKKLLLVIFAMIFCISSLANCQTPTENPEQTPTDDQKHGHVWGGSTAPRTKYYFTRNCSICGAQERVIVGANAYWEAACYANGEIILEEPVRGGAAIYKDGKMIPGEPITGDTAVELVAIDKINIRNAGFHDSFADITLCIRANESKTYRAYIESYQSGDNLGSSLREDLVLVQGEETTFNFKVWGFNDVTYMVSIEIDNTVIVLYIIPTVSN